jgi:hypothetical protein
VSGCFRALESSRSGGFSFFSFSALYIAHGKRGGASPEVMLRVRVRIVRRGVFSRFLKNEEVGACAHHASLHLAKKRFFRQGEFSGHVENAIEPPRHQEHYG